jgi:hypothetical protein
MAGWQAACGAGCVAVRAVGAMLHADATSARASGATKRMCGARMAPS